MRLWSGYSPVRLRDHEPTHPSFGSRASLRVGSRRFDLWGEQSLRIAGDDVSSHRGPLDMESAAFCHHYELLWALSECRHCDDGGLGYRDAPRHAETIRHGIRRQSSGTLYITVFGHRGHTQCGSRDDRPRIDVRRSPRRLQRPLAHRAVAESCEWHERLGKSFSLLARIEHELLVAVLDERVGVKGSAVEMRP